MARITVFEPKSPTSLLPSVKGHLFLPSRARIKWRLAPPFDIWVSGQAESTEEQPITSTGSGRRLGARSDHQEGVSRGDWSPIHHPDSFVGL